MGHGVSKKWWEYGTWGVQEVRRWGDGVEWMKRELDACGANVGMHTTEVYSPPRVNTMAETIWTIPGFSMDLESCGSDDG